MFLCSVKHYLFFTTCKTSYTYLVLFFTYKDVEFYSSISVYGTAFIQGKKKPPKRVPFLFFW